MLKIVVRPDFDPPICAGIRTWHAELLRRTSGDGAAPYPRPLQHWR